MPMMFSCALYARFRKAKMKLLSSTWTSEEKEGDDFFNFFFIWSSMTASFFLL